MSVINGSDLLVYIEGSGSANAFAYATSHTLNITMATRDTSNKTSGNYTQIANGRLTVTGNASGLMVYDANYNYEKILDLIVSRSAVDMYFGNTTSSTDDALDESEFYASG